MLPSPPPTDPDVQFSRIRFLTLELRSRRRKYKAVVTCWSGPCPMLHRPARSAIHCRSVDRCTRFCVLGPVARQWLSMPRRLPSLGRVPLGTVPRRHQYYEDATTPRTASPLAYWVRSQVPRRPPVFVLAAALPHSRRCRTGQDLCSAGGPIPAVVAWTIRDLPGSLATHPVPLPRSRTPVGRRSWPITERRCCPRGEDREGSGDQNDFGACHGASAHAVYASRAPSREPRQDSLPAGRLSASTVRESNPLDRFERFQVTYMAFLLSRACPGATSLRSG